MGFMYLASQEAQAGLSQPFPSTAQAPPGSTEARGTPSTCLSLPQLAKHPRALGSPCVLVVCLAFGPRAEVMCDSTAILTAC